MMQVKYVDIGKIIPYGNNPRKNERAVEYVRNSIEEFGFKVPIVLDKDNVIVAGHTRRLAAMSLDMKKVPCYIADDLTEEQVRAFRLADNRVASFSVWDEEKLAEEISSILDIDLSDFGFKEDMIADVFRDTAEQKIHMCPKCGHEWSEDE